MKTKKAFLFTIVMIGLLCFQTASNFFPRASDLLQTNSNLITLSMLGETDRILYGPYASYFFRFYTPVDWAIKGSGQIQLHIDASYMLNGRMIGEGQYGSGATMDVNYNGEYIKTFAINWVGENTVTIQIPEKILQTPRTDGSSSLYLFLNAAVDCDLLDHKTSIVLKSDSGFIIPHDVKAPDPDLSKLPRPIYDESPLHTSTAILVVPDNAQAEEIRAAMIVQAGFSRMVGGNMSLPIYKVGELNEPIRQNNHMIFVGLGTKFTLLHGLAFPAYMDSAKISWSDSQPDDGIIQMILSPRNNGHYLLYIGGNTVVGVQKAAQAFSTGKLQIGPKPNLMVISQVHEEDVQPIAVETRTLLDLGYETQTLRNFGVNLFVFNFYMNPGMLPGANPYINVVYAHSALLDFARSGLFVRLNNQPIGSAVFTAETAKGTNTLNVALPSNLIRSGYNRITIEADLVPYDNCSLFQTNNLWTTISSETKIFLPLIKALAGTISSNFNLGRYPYPFNEDPSLKNIAFIIDANDADSLRIANQLAASLGRAAAGTVLSMNFAYADQVPESIKNDYHLIILGKPSQLPIITELAKYLPAPFETGSDLASEKGLQVTYRLPAGSSLGYLQLLPSPWNDQRAILAVLGSTPQGLQWAGNALLSPDLTTQLAGNYNVISETQILTTDTRLQVGTANLGATAVPGSIPIVPTSPQATTEQYPGYNRSWLVSGMVLVSIAVLAIVISVISSRLKNRVRRPEKLKDVLKQQPKTKTKPKSK